MEKLLYFLKALFEDLERWALFREYLGSPLHANSPKSMELLDAIKATLEYGPSDLELDLCSRVFPSKAPDDVKTRNHLRRNLSPLLEHYFEFEAFMSYREDRPAIWSRVIEKANSAKWDQYFPWLYHKKALFALESIPQTELYFWYRTSLADHWDRYLHRGEKDQGKDPDRYLLELDSLFNCFAIYQLKLACNKKIQGIVWEIDQQTIPMLDHLLGVIPEKWDGLPEVAKMYYMILRCLDAPNDHGLYTQLEPLLLENVLRLPLRDSQGILSHFENIYTLRFNETRAKQLEDLSIFYRERLMRLVNFQLENELLFETADGRAYLDHGKFKNIITLYAMAGEYDRAERFITRYSSKLLRINEKVASNYALGILHFFREDFAHAGTFIYQAWINLRESTDHQYALSIRNYYLRILFEQGEMEDCSRELAYAKRVVLRNRHYPAETKTKFVHFVNHLSELCRIATLPPREKKKSIVQFQSNLDSEPLCLSRAWLTEKARAMERPASK